MKRVLKIGGVVILVLVVVLVIFGSLGFAAPEYPTPSGPHRVGTLEVAFIDDQRLERFGPEPRGQREVGARIWYPAAADAEGARLPTLDGRVNKAFSDLYGAPVGEEDGPPSASIIDAPPLAGDERLPVVIFSHGGFAHRRQSLSTMEELASQGFIVISIGHTHESLLALLPEGRTVAMDPGIAKGMDALVQTTGAEHDAVIERLNKASSRDQQLAAARELGDVMTKMMSEMSYTPAELAEVRRGDIALVVSRLASLDADADHLLNGRYDIERVGVFGHSMGAHVAMASCLNRELPVKACVAYDSAYYLFDEQSVPTLERPMLVAYADLTEFNLAGSNDYLLRDATAETLSVVVSGASHMNFTDMNYMPRFLSWMGVLGSIDGARAGTIINDLTVSFFREHLLGEQQPWLDSPGERYPELR